MRALASATETTDVRFPMMARIVSLDTLLDELLPYLRTLGALFGQRRASTLVRPRPSPGVARRIDALLPETPFRFWNSDRI